MTVAYQTVQLVSKIQFPYWETTWPASDGCSTRTLIHTAVSVDPSQTPTTLYYEPVTQRVVNDTRRLSGRSGLDAYPFVHTPRWRGTYTDINHLLKRRNCNAAMREAFQYGHVAKVNGYCTNIVDSVDFSEIQLTQWDDVTHNFAYSEYQLNEFKSSDIANAITEVTNELNVKSRTSYDFLTEIAEARELPGLVRSVSGDLLNILKALRGRFKISDLRRMSLLRPIDLLKHPNEVFKRFGDQWMRYRYGIMPMVYSYRDVKKLLHRGKNTTDHSRRVLSPTSKNISLPGAGSFYKWSQYEGEITIRGTVFQHFDYLGESWLSGIGVNPLVTAWELIPYSFVIDWFVNVGDYIAASTSQSLARYCGACISRRSNYTKKIWAHFPNQDLSVSVTNRIPSNWVGSTPPAPPNQTVSRPEESQILREEKTNEYLRWQVNVDGAQLNWNPSLNWKRWTDAAAMANNLLRSYLRNLK